MKKRIQTLYHAISARLRQQIENEYYANPTKAIAGEVIELKMMIKQVEGAICSEPLG